VWKHHRCPNYEKLKTSQYQQQPRLRRGAALRAAGAGLAMFSMFRYFEIYDCLANFRGFVGISADGHTLAVLAARACAMAASTLLQWMCLQRTRIDKKVVYRFML
jgi:hypothetical protein